MSFIITLTAIILGCITLLMWPTIKLHYYQWYRSLQTSTKFIIGKTLFIIDTTAYYWVFYWCSRDILPTFNWWLNLALIMLLATVIFISIATCILLITFNNYYEEDKNEKEYTISIKGGEIEFADGKKGTISTGEVEVTYKKKDAPDTEKGTVKKLKVKIDNG